MDLTAKELFEGYGPRLAALGAWPEHLGYDPLLTPDDGDIGRFWYQYRTDHLRIVPAAALLRVAAEDACREAFPQFSPPTEEGENIGYSLGHSWSEPTDDTGDHPTIHHALWYLLDAVIAGRKA